MSKNTNVVPFVDGKSIQCECGFRQDEVSLISATQAKKMFELRDAALKAVPSTSQDTLDYVTLDRNEWREATIMANENARREESKRREMQDERDVLRTELAALKAAPSTSTGTTGAEMICAERARQMAVEGWTPKHDAQYATGVLAWAAVCYAAPAPVYKQQTAPLSVAFIDPWPSEWADKWDKRPKNGKALAAPNPAERIAMLAKAGALIAAEIDRLRAKTIKGGA